MKKLKEADHIQDKTLEALTRAQRQAAEAEELGAQTIDELRRQGQQMVSLMAELFPCKSREVLRSFCEPISGRYQL